MVSGSDHLKTSGVFRQTTLKHIFACGLFECENAAVATAGYLLRVMRSGYALRRAPGCYALGCAPGLHATVLFKGCARCTFEEF